MEGRFGGTEEDAGGMTRVTEFEKRPAITSHLLLDIGPVVVRFREDIPRMLESDHKFYRE